VCINGSGLHTRVQTKDLLLKNGALKVLIYMLKNKKGERLLLLCEPYFFVI
jgi:hypothetical protein